MTESREKLSDYTAKHDAARFEENREIASANRLLRADLNEERARREASELRASHLEVELDLFKGDYSQRPGWADKALKSTKVNRGTLVAMLSDTHYGEVVNPEEMGGYNKYDLAIAALRTEKFFKRTVLLSRDFLAGVKYDGIFLALGGDLVSGDIHDELTQTNALSTYRTVEWAIPYLAEGIELWLKAFGKVHVVSAPGNHGRNSIKPRHKKRSENNADTHIAKLLAREFRTIDGVTFDVPESSDSPFTVYGSRFTMEHGDNFKFNGTAEIGSLGPIKRGTLRNIAAKQVEGRPFDYQLLGHFHQYIPADTQGFVANGSLKGYDEYARDGKFRPEKPKQALMVVTPEYGITTQMPVFVEDRKAEKW